MLIKTRLLVVLSGVLFSSLAQAQDEDLLGMVEEDAPKKEYVYNTYKSSRVIMAQSMEMLRPGVLDFRILHRFGRLNGGAYELFGLDGPATVRLGLDYGITDNFTIGVGRSTFNKELDGFMKWRIIHQSKGPSSVPFSLVAVGGSTITTLKWADPSRKNYFSSRMAYYGQLIAGRKFSESITMQLMPTMVHRNLVPGKDDPHDLFSLGAGGRFKLTRRISFNVDYHYVINQQKSAGIHNPLSLGFDFETGGHVFQLHFTNSKGMNERSFLADTEYDWANSDIFFGFNISRSFQFGK